MGDRLNPTSVHDLAGCDYVLLTTYTADGRAKPTPVWVAADGDALVVVTSVKSWKFRRARRTPRVTLAACDARGNPRGGPVDGVVVTVEDPPLVERVERALRRRYGWQYASLEVARRVLPFVYPGGKGGLVIRDVVAA